MQRLFLSIRTAAGGGGGGGGVVLSPLCWVRCHFSICLHLPVFPVLFVFSLWVYDSKDRDSHFRGTARGVAGACWPSAEAEGHRELSHQDK